MSSAGSTMGRAVSTEVSAEPPGGGGAVVRCDGAALAYGRSTVLTGVTGQVAPGTVSRADDVSGPSALAE